MQFVAPRNVAIVDRVRICVLQRLRRLRRLKALKAAREAREVEDMEGGASTSVGTAHENPATHEVEDEEEQDENAPLLGP